MTVRTRAVLSGPRHPQDPAEEPPVGRDPSGIAHVAQLLPVVVQDHDPLIRAHGDREGEVRASTSPLEMASPSPVSPVSPARLRKRCGMRSGAIPRPLSETESAMWVPSTRIDDDGGECRAGLASRLFGTCPMRWGSTIAGGRSGGRSTTVWRPPPVRKVLRVLSTGAATLAAPGATTSTPVQGPCA